MHLLIGGVPEKLVHVLVVPLVALGKASFFNPSDNRCANSPSLSVHFCLKVSTQLRSHEATLHCSKKIPYRRLET